MFAKKNGRVSFRSNRRSNYKKNTNPYSINKPRAKGNITQLHEKYSKLAKEASSSGDRIQSEYYYQFADHYSRLINELGLRSLVNENRTEIDEENVAANEDQISQDKEKNELLDANEKKESENIPEKDSDSIETVSFIAKPAKKTSSKTKKALS